MIRRTGPVRIAGAGIAGLTAAFALAKRGFDVEVLELNKRSGVRFGGDLQGIENWIDSEDALDFIRKQGISVDFDATPMRRVAIVLPDGRIEWFDLRRPPFYLVRRGGSAGDLDASLEAQARANPRITIQYGHRVTDPSEVEIMAIGPDVADKPIDGIVAGYTFDTDHEDLAVLLLDNRYAPSGYGYLLVRNGYGVVSTCLFTHISEALRFRDACVPYLLEKFPAVKPRNLRTYGGIGNFFEPRRDPNGRPWVGEAGGFQDFLWGFGMRNAMASGSLAAESVATGVDFLKLTQPLLRIQRASIGNRFLYQQLGNRGYHWLVRTMRRSPDPTAALGVGYRPNWWNRLAYPVARLAYARNLRDHRSFNRGTLYRERR